MLRNFASVAVEVRIAAPRDVAAGRWAGLRALGGGEPAPLPAWRTGESAGTTAGGAVESPREDVQRQDVSTMERSNEMLRSVRLPEEISGKLFLHSMLGRWEELEEARRWLAEQRVERIVSLAPLDEIRRKSPVYAEAIEQQVLKPDILPVEDFGVPEDRGTFVATAKSVAADLTGGKNVLVHCGAGIGRTGTFACCVLLALGRTLAEAREEVEAAGSGAETNDQRDLLRWCAQQLQALRETA